MMALSVPCNSFSLETALENQTQSQTVYKINLKTAMHLAVQHSVLLKAANAQTRSAEDNKNAALRAFGPNLQGSATNLWTNHTMGSQMLKTQESNLTSNGSLQLTQPILGMIPLYDMLSQENVALKINQTLERSSEIQAALLGAQYFLNYELMLSNVVTAQATLTTLEKSKQDAETLYQTGAIYKADYLGITLQYTQSQQSLLASQSNLKKAQFFLAQILGMPDVSNIQVSSNHISHYEKHNLQIPDLEKAKVEALLENKDIEVANDNIELAEKKKSVSEDNYLPSLNAVVNFQKNFNSYEINNNLQPENQIQFGLQLQWKIFDWGVRAAQNGALASQIENSKFLAEDKKESILRDVVNQYYDIVNNFNAVKTAKESVATADEAFHLESFRFLNGDVKSLDLITAQENLTKSMGDLAQARFNLDLAWLTFETILGKFPSFS